MCSPRCFAALALLAQVPLPATTADLPAIELDSHGAISALTTGGQRFAATQRMGLFVRDSPAGELVPVPLATTAEAVARLDALAVRTTARLDSPNGHLRLTGSVEDLRQDGDRGVDVILRVPFAPAVWWSGLSEKVLPGEPPRPARKRAQEQLVEGAAALEPLEDGGLAQNFSPVACVTGPDEIAGLALALPPDAPCRFRFALLRAEGCIELQWLFGLSSSASGHLKSRAPFACELFTVDGRWGLRDAWRRYWELHPGFFQRRTKASGLWLVSAPALDAVPDPANYAFWQTTRPRDTGRGIQLGLEVYPYTIAGQRELGYLKQPVAAYEDVLRLLAAKPESTHRSRYTWEEVTALVATSGLQGPDGRWLYRLRTTDWAGQSVSFPTNPSPFLPSTPEHSTVAEHTLAEVARDLREHPTIHGSFVDSLAMWGSYENYRRDHFAAARCPLTHDAQGRVSLPNWMPHVDYLRELRKRIAPRLIFGNGARPGRAFCAVELDIFGVEFSPRDLENRTQMDFARCLAGPKPVLGLFDYPPAGLAREQMEHYVQRATALAILPESRHLPWPKYKDRDADLLARFLPICRRLDRAGWQPVTRARVTPASLWLERFGTQPPDLYFSVFNPGSDPATVSLAPDAGNGGRAWRELVTNQPLASPPLELSIPAQSLRVIQAEP